MPLTTLITDRGRQILASRVPGDPPFASICIAAGDGAGIMPVPNNAQLALVNERWRGVGAASLNGTRIGFSVNIPAAIGGWTLREIGVFIGPAGAEELAIVSQFGPQYKPAAGENGAASLTPVLYIDYSGSIVGAFTITLDPNLLPIDPSVHRTVNARAAVPPASPVDGSVYAIAAGASGEWAGRDGQIARRRGTAWAFETALDGHIIREAGASGAFWQKSGADYIAVVFPQAAHHHDDRYFTEAEADDRFVKKVGDTMTGALLLPGGSAAAPALAQSGDANTGLMFPGADQLALVTGGVERMRVNAGGAVGINTNAPLSALDVNGDVTFRANVLGSNPTLGRTFSSDPLETATLGGFLQLFPSAHAAHAGKVVLGNNNAERLSVWNNGAIAFAGNPGTIARVLTGNPSGPPAWKTLAELGAGRKIIAAGTLTQQSTNITFAAEPDASYTGFAFFVVPTGDGVQNTLGASIGATSKTTTGCTFQCPISSGSPVSFQGFYIVFR